jgi:hypothetical protein
MSNKRKALSEHRPAIKQISRGAFVPKGKRRYPVSGVTPGGTVGKRYRHFVKTAQYSAVPKRNIITNKNRNYVNES